MGRDPNAQGNSRRWIMAACDNSLRRLGIDYIDMYQIHRPSPETDIDETLGALTDLVRAGKIRYFGSSTFPAHEIVEAQWVADTGAASASSPSSRRIQFSCAASRRTSCPCARSTGWACCRGARWPVAGFRVCSGRARRTPAVAPAMLPHHYDMAMPGNQ